MFNSSRAIAILGDEGIQLYFAGRLGVRFVGHIEWGGASFQKEFSKLLKTKCRRAPVYLINDMVEQYYRKEQIPNVGFLDQKNIVKRRLRIAFPNYRINGAVKEPVTPDMSKISKGESAYLFAAVPGNERLQKTLEAIREEGIALLGLYLLPAESAQMVQTLSRKYSRALPKTAWTIFVGQHNNGYLRQIVTRNGTLALTRMTPIVDTDVEPALWAKEVSNEIAATMSYLARFGYKNTDGLCTVIVADDPSMQPLDILLHQDGDVHIKRASEVLSDLNLKALGGVKGRQAEPVHAAYLGRKTKFLMPMDSVSIAKLTQPRKIASFILLSLSLLTTVFGFYAFKAYREHQGARDELSIALQQNGVLQQQYREELQKQKDLGIDFALVSTSLEVFKDFDDQKIKPLPVIREIGRALGPDLHLFNLQVKQDSVRRKTETVYDGTVPLEEEYDHFMDITLSLSFPPETDPELGVRVIETLSQRLSANLPNYAVTIEKQIAGLDYTENFVGGEREATTDKDYTAEIKIRGAIQ